MTIHNGEKNSDEKELEGMLTKITLVINYFPCKTHINYSLKRKELIQI